MGASSSSLLGDSRGGVIVLHKRHRGSSMPQNDALLHEDVSEKSTQGMNVQSHTAGMCACQGWSGAHNGAVQCVALK